jgi:hypothetical protein
MGGWLIRGRKLEWRIDGLDDIPYPYTERERDHAERQTNVYLSNIWRGTRDSGQKYSIRLLCAIDLKDAENVRDTSLG